MRKIFIAGTGTDIGKTFVTSALVHQLRQKFKVLVAKPIISGWNNNCDTHVLLTVNQQFINDETIENCSPWRFNAPLSLDIAADLEGRKIDFDKVLKFCFMTGQGADYALIEGAGGVMTPINRDKTFRDLILKLQLPTLLVTGSYLGSISHCLTALESLRGLAKITIIVNESEDSDVSLVETAASIQRFTKHKVLTIARCASFKDAPDLSALI